MDDCRSSKFFVTSLSTRLAWSWTPLNLVITRNSSFSTASHASIVHKSSYLHRLDFLFVYILIRFINNCYLSTRSKFRLQSWVLSDVKNVRIWIAANLLCQFMQERTTRGKKIKSNKNTINSDCDSMSHTLDAHTSNWYIYLIICVLLCCDTAIVFVFFPHQSCFSQNSNRGPQSTVVCVPRTRCRPQKIK